MDLSDSVLDHLRRVAALPDLTETRYELEGEIGRGGSAWCMRRATASSTGAWRSRCSTRRWRAKRSSIARLEHPAIVPVYENGTLPDGRAFYAMKLVGGARLDRYLDGAPSLARAAAGDPAHRRGARVRAHARRDSPRTSSRRT